MIPFESLYEWKCSSPICWFVIKENKCFEPDYVREKHNVIDIIIDCLKIDQRGQKRHAIQTRSIWETRVGDLVYLRVGRTKGVKRYGTKGEHIPKYIGPLTTCSHKGLAYELELPIGLSKIHKRFHIYKLRKLLKPLEEPLSHTKVRIVARSIIYGTSIKDSWIKLEMTHQSSNQVMQGSVETSLEREATKEKWEDSQCDYPQLFRYRGSITACEVL